MQDQPVTIRCATLNDADALVAGNIAMALETEGRELKHEAVLSGVRRALADDRRGVYYVAERGGSVVGQMLLTHEWSDWRDGVFWWIQSVYVVPEARRGGVYRALHRHVEDRARRTPDVCGLRLYVEAENRAAQRVYERMGMTPTSYRLYETVWPVTLPATSGAAGGPPSDVDLYCLECGYNLRGLSGDPRRCPECGYDNPVGAIELPADIIRKQLRRMETAPALCVGAVLCLTPFVLILALSRWVYLGNEILISVLSISVLGLAAWTWSAARFRSSCRASPGWFAALLRYHVCGLGLTALVLGVIIGGVWSLQASTGPARNPSAMVGFLGGLALIAAIVALVIGFVGVRLHRWLKAAMEPLQREVAVTLARERTRRELARGRRRRVFA